MKFAKFVFILSVLVIAASLPVIAVQAAPLTTASLQEAQPAELPTLEQTLASLLSLGGFAALVAGLVNAGKTFRVIPDGSAPTVSLLLNLGGLVTLTLLQLAGRSDLVPVLDANAGALAQVLTAVLALVYQLIVSRQTHAGALAGLPVIGKSYSGNLAGSGLVVEINKVIGE